MSPSVSSVPEGALVGTPEHGYLWTCSLCGGLGIVEEQGKLTDCPKCETAHQFGVAFELVRRNTTPVVPACERFASPSVGAPSFVYEVWEFFIEEGTARRVAVEDDVGAAYIAKWNFEDAAYGPIEVGMGSSARSCSPSPASGPRVMGARGNPGTDTFGTTDSTEE